MVKQVKPLEYKEVKKEMDKSKYIEVEFKDEGGERMGPDNSKTISTVLILLAGICMIVAFIALIGMFSDFAEFGAYVEQLKEQIQMMYPFTWEQYWNNPLVQETISDGYAQLARDPLMLAIPMIIIGIILIVGSRVVAKKAKGSSGISQVKPITASEPIKRNMDEQLEPITH